MFQIKTSEISRNLKVEPDCGQLEPMTNIKFNITYQPNTLGPFDEEIKIMVR